MNVITQTPFPLLLLTLFIIPSAAHNITAILSAFPQYSSFNSYLSQTKLCDDINNRKPITVLALTDSALSPIVDKQPLSVIKHALSLHILLDYFDAKKLHKLSDGTALSTTLYQTTGEAQGQLGFVNITDKKGGKVCFGSAVPGSPLNSTYTKEVKKFPYSLSVIEISEPIRAPGVLAAPSASDVNITSLLNKAGCKTFASLIVSSGVIKTYQAAADKGLTIFAPSDDGFKAKEVPDLSKLTNAELVALLEYHALTSYSPVGTLKSSKGPLKTMATNGAGKYDITVTTAGDEVTLHAGRDTSRVAMTVIDTTPLCIYKVDSVLLPAELFGNATSPVSAPGSAPATAPAPVSKAPSPASPLSPAPVPAKSKSPKHSPPAPPAESPVDTPYGSPADAPSDDEDTVADSATKDGKGVAFAKAAIAVAITVTCSIFMS